MPKSKAKPKSATSLSALDTTPISSKSTTKTLFFQKKSKKTQLDTPKLSKNLSDHLINDSSPHIHAEKGYSILNASLLPDTPNSSGIFDSSNSHEIHSASIASTSSAFTGSTAFKKSHTRKESRSNIKFHQVFPSVPIDEIVLETYSCASVKSLNLFHGVMFITKNYVCFYSKILAYETIFIIKLSSIRSISKTMHALIFPTAIKISTQNSTYLFSSFRSRTVTYDYLIKAIEEHRIDNNINAPLNPMTMNVISPITSKHRRSKAKLMDDCSDDKSADEEIEAEKRDNSEGESILDTVNMNTPDTDDLLLVSDKQSLAENENKNNKHAHLVNHASSYENRTNYERSKSFFYELDFGDLSTKSNTVTVSLRHKRSLLQKVKMLLTALIPGFFNISRIDSLLPICFLMCVLLLLNAFVLLGKVNQVDDIFAKLLAHRASIH